MPDIPNECTSGYVKDLGRTDGATIAVGYVGQVISAAVARASSIALVSGVETEICSIDLTPGVWEISKSVFFTPEALTTIGTVLGGHCVDALPLWVGNGTVVDNGGAVASSIGTSSDLTARSMVIRTLITVTSTYRLKAKATFGVDALKAWGTITAVRKATA